ncbi:MAG: flagellar M-ring protein [Actinomycetota bacterium]|nr:MAG: flagellar M-ring protein [Actinomycetota bacterium]
MEQLKHRIRGLLAMTTPAQQVGIVVSIVVLALGVVVFSRWLTSPSYALLYANLDDRGLAQVVQELEAQGVPYRIEGGGTRVMVPQDRVYRVRAQLAEAGISGQTLPPGYEIFDQQGLGATDFQQRVDYQRALEGELARTLMEMDGIRAASVRLAIPERSPFEQDQPSVTASVLVDPAIPLSEQQVRSIVLLVGNAVPGLTPEGVTVADTQGTVLAVPGEDPLGMTGGRTFELTHEYERALAADVQRLLASVPGGQNASVVVRAQLNFDQSSVETETVDPNTAVPIDSSATREVLDQAGGGQTGQAGGGVNYQRTEDRQTFAVSRETTTTVRAPGRVERLSVAVVLDNGANTGITPADPAEVERVVSAALGLDPTRGDTIEVTQLPFPKTTPSEEPTGGGLVDQAPRLAGGLVVVLVGVALFLMMLRSRGKRRGEPTPELAWGRPEVLPPAQEAGAEAPRLAVRPATTDVMELVQQQPEEIATLLRSWLADRRR